MAANLNPVVGKKRGKKKNKNKKPPVYPQVKPVFFQVPSMQFQAPHQQPETMVDLFDDTAPNSQFQNFQNINNPLLNNPVVRKALLNTPRPGLLPTPGMSNWTPVPQEAAGPSESDQLTASALEQRWKTFQQNLQKKLAQRADAKKTGNLNPQKGKPGGKKTAKTAVQQGAKKQTLAPTFQQKEDKTTLSQQNNSQSSVPKEDVMQTPTQQETTAQNTLQKEADKQTSEQPENKAKSEIVWELNPKKMEQKEESEQNKGKNTVAEQSDLGNKDNTNQNTPKVVEGMASEIKFVIEKKPEQKPTVVKETYDTRRSRTPSSSSSYNPVWGAMSYPKGVPRSFLKPQQQNFGAIQPQNGQASSWTTPTPLPFEELHVATDYQAGDQQYSPSDMFDEHESAEQKDDGQSENTASGQKRLSAFHRLGPVSQPKKPKLTINLLCNSDQSVREVVDEDIEDKYMPVHQRKDIVNSSNDIVKKYLQFWPWKKNLNVRRSVTARQSKSVMLLELEQMEELYDKENIFILITVKGYPEHWRKEDVLDTLLEHLKGKSFIPCFTEFTKQECKFAVIRSRTALTVIHKLGFSIRKDDVELTIVISNVDLTINMLDFIPRLVLRKILAQGYDGERKLDLSSFTLQSDLSHFIYYPLHRMTNQSEIISLQSTVVWNYLTDLNLSHNRLTSIDAFDLRTTTPKLKNLDLSFNNIERITMLLRCRELALQTIKLEGNPLCHDYIDPREYVRVIRMLFPGVVEIDGVKFQRKGEFPQPKRNYCVEEAQDLVERFLNVFFNLLDSEHDERVLIEDMYHEDAVMTITHRYNLRYKPIFTYNRNLFKRARSFEEGEMDSVQGARNIAKLIDKWPMLQHDPSTFNVDVMHHGEMSTIIRINGILKPIVESLAEDEHLLAFTRTVVLTTTDGDEYKIQNELLYWEEPCREYANKAFHVNLLRPKKLSLKLESPPDEELKAKLLDIFLKITDGDRIHAERCLEWKEWNLKNAIEYYLKLVKQDDFDSMKV